DARIHADTIRLHVGAVGADQDFLARELSQRVAKLSGTPANRDAAEVGEVLRAAIEAGATAETIRRACAERVPSHVLAVLYAGAAIMYAQHRLGARGLTLASLDLPATAQELAERAAERAEADSNARCSARLHEHE